LVCSDRRATVPKGLCLVCREPITAKGRRATCSRECRRIADFVSFVAVQRRYVYRRDHGVCALCDVHTAKQRRIKRLAAKRRWALGLSGRLWRLPAGWGDWEMDHILPVCEGGGPSWDETIEMMMRNLRTLCPICHKQVTREMRRRRAASGAVA